MAYRVEIVASAERQIRKLPRAVQVRLRSVIMALANDPRPHGCLKMSGHDDTYRVRMGAYRVVYSIMDERLVVLVLKVGDRKSVYR